MSGPFKLRSGNKSPLEFKQMGSSPAEGSPNKFAQAMSMALGVVEKEKEDLKERHQQEIDDIKEKAEKKKEILFS